MKIRNNIVFVLLFFTGFVFAQIQNPLAIYRAEKERVNNLQHTKLKVDFNFKDKTLNGEAWLTLSPHFYPTNKVVLDAKAMLIHAVTLDNKTVPYDYDGFKLAIELPKTYQENESYTLYIKYTAQPEKVKQKGSAAITDAKGLYFINPLGNNKEKPTQIWTQGETEASSCWFPTIDSPNQKTTQEIYITVPKKYTTLSNGELVSQTENGDNRTDYWKLDQKHAPYLFFMGVGEYEVIKDQYKNIPVNYYVEKQFAPYAKEIFGLTSEMMRFFENKLGVAYPWNKYSQIVGRDYVSGAMENTTAVIHGENAYQTPGQLIDGNRQENTIAHELFHHWFGNLVTTESWSNLTLNESFANYSEYLWREYKYGKTDAEAHRFEEIKAYKEGSNYDKNLVRFRYVDKEDMFDAVSYNKGGAILHMLRTYLGDKAFFKGLNIYLNKYKYQAAEVHQLRLVFEELTGKDLNWFFNQWYYGSGHPKIQVSYDYNLLEKTVTVNLLQTQANEFQFPLSIDIYENGKPTRYQVFAEGRDASFTLSYKSNEPDLVLINSDAALLADFTENKTLKDYIYQLKHATTFNHKREALLEVAKKQDDKKAFEAISNALNDDYYKIRILALQQIDLINKWAKSDAIDKIKYLAQNDKKTLVQAAAIETLGKLIDVALQPIFEKALQSKSYSVLGSALVSLYYIDKTAAIAASKKLPSEAKQSLATPLTRIYINEKDESEMDFVAKNVISGIYLNNDPKIQEIYRKAFDHIAKSNNVKAITNLVDDIVSKGKQYKQYNFDKIGINLLRDMVQKQKNTSNTSKQVNLGIIEAGIERLVL